MSSGAKHATIEICGLTIGYRTRRRVKVVASGLDAAIRCGELTCLLGANGVGKSTLLRTLSGFLPPLGGRVRILGRSIEAYRTAELARVLGVVLTEKFDVQNMTVEELVGMGRSPYTGFWGTLGREDRRIVSEAIEQVGIGELRERMVQTLSDGERQKAMISKALAQQTPVIFLDEPTAFLDYPSKVEIMQLLQRLTRETGKTVFLSTHDLELALQIADRLWLMDRESDLQVGVPEDLSLDGRMERFFSRRGIVFDRRVGLFRVDTHGTRRLVVSGEGERYEMVCKALRRRGIEPDCGDDRENPSVEVGSETLLLRTEGGSTVCRTVGELLERLEES